MFRLQIINSCFTGLLTVKTRPDELSDNNDISLSPSLLFTWDGISSM